MSKYINVNKVSEYGKKHGFVDYGYLANYEVDNMILANNMGERLFDQLEVESGQIFKYYDVEGKEVDSDGHLDFEHDELVEVCQWFIINYSSAKRLQVYNELVFYDIELDIYVWGVTHCGTGWDYVLTDVPLPVKEDN